MSRSASRLEDRLAEIALDGATRRAYNPYGRKGVPELVAVPETISFSASHLPAHLDDRARYAMWRDIYSEIAELDISRSADLPFVAEFAAVPIGALTLATMDGTIKGVTRTTRHIARDGTADYCLLINTGTAPMSGTFRSRPVSIAPGAAALQTFGEPLSLSGGVHNSWASLVLPRAALTSAFAGIDDLVSREIGRDNEALGLLVRYCQMIAAGPALLSEAMTRHATETVIDLVGLATSANGDDAERAGLRGLRAARLRAVLAAIRRGFTEPAISAERVARELNLSVRYVHDLLQETGTDFSGQVLELRLQRVRAMLADPRCGEMRIAAIALAAGFSDISYFNRSFRRRFGCAPSAAR